MILGFGSPRRGRAKFLAFFARASSFAGVQFMEDLPAHNVYQRFPIPRIIARYQRWNFPNYDLYYYSYSLLENYYCARGFDQICRDQVKNRFFNFNFRYWKDYPIIDNLDKKNFRQQVEKVTFSFLSTLRNFWIPSSICFAHFRQRASKLGETWKHRRWNGQVRAASAPSEIVECKSGIKFSNTSVTSPISESSPIFSARLRFCTGEPRPGGRPRVRNADEFANPPIRVKRQTSQFLFPVFPAVIFADPLKNIRVLDVLTAR